MFETETVGPCLVRKLKWGEGGGRGGMAPLALDKAQFIICADLECITEKIDECKNNPENSSTTKVSEYIPSGFSISTISPFRSIENKHDVYRGKDCMKKFCEFLRKHAMKIINFKKKKVKLLTKEQQESYENAKICYICKEKF